MIKQPNILMIVSDEHSPSKLGCYGNDEVKTPHLDQLAEGGVIFERAYCNSPLCVPSRLSFLTGQYPWKIGAWSLLSSPPDNQPTMQSHLSQNGYHTIAIGKMHFVGDNQMWGFDERPYGDFKGGSHQPDPLHLAPNFSFLPAMPSEISEDEMQESVVNRVALEFLETYNSDDPFFMIASYNKPHFPLTPPKRFWDMYRPEDLQLPDLGANFPQRLHPWMRRHREFHRTEDWTEDETRRALAGYYGCITFIDEKIGELVHAIDRKGIRDNTVIIYLSDHGDMCGEHGLWGKSCFYEDSVRVPLIINMPSRFEAGQRISEIVELVDLFPTVANVSHHEISHEIDGESLLSLISGDPQKREKTFAISELYGHSAVAPMRMLAKDQWKYIQYLDAQPSLFNLVEDPHEFNDLSGNAQYQDIIEIYDAFLRSDWDEQLVRDNFRYSGERGKMKSPRKKHYPNQFKKDDGRLIDAETFYPAEIYPGSE